MDVLVIALSFLMFTSCAKIGYVYEQGVGQISLLAKARDNDKVMKNVRLPLEYREKIKKIEELKKYFYHFWGMKETRIYSQTTLLQSQAVTYLVVVSEFNDIKVVENCFPVMGCFPYLGFFNLDSAKKFAKEKEEEGKVTWIRPVYAYSTLGYLTDTILSSFFHYNEYELTELIFHELFHTIFFIKNEVEINENLANFFSRKMLRQYYSGQEKSKEFQLYLEEEKLHHQISLKIVDLALELKEIYKALAPKEQKEASDILVEFTNKKMRPELEKFCLKKECPLIERDWNNASLAAFLTYENKTEELDKLFQKNHSDIK